MATNQNCGIGPPKHPLTAPRSLLASARPLLDTAEHSDRERGKTSRTKRSSSAGPATRHVLGYPTSWPAGPWVVPLFWLTVLTLVLLLRFLG